MPNYTVQQGDCILSLARDNGLTWDTIWNHASNAGLKQQRNNDPNVLLPGDVVFIPDKTLRSEACATDQKHLFCKKGTTAQVRLRLLDWKKEPRPAIAYSASIDGTLVSGQSDSDGYIKLQAPPNARMVQLTVTDSNGNTQYSIPLGHIDPIDSPAGVQQRLTNLGYSCGSEQGAGGPLTTAALRAYQSDMNLPVTGEADDATVQSLKQTHGC